MDILNDTPITKSDILFTKANGIDIAYQTFGNASDPAILLVMGLGGQLIWWEEGLCEQLAANGFYVIRYDNRDCGESTWFTGQPFPKMGDYLKAMLLKRLPTNTAYLLTDMADDAIGLLDALNVEQAHWVGMSMGGMIAQTAVIHHPHRCLTLTSIMSHTGNPKQPRPKNDMLKMLFSPSPTDREGYIEHNIKITQAMNGDKSPINIAETRRLSEIVFDRGRNPEGTARQMGAIVASGSRKADLANVTAPTLVIHGDNDPLVNVAGGIDTANCIPNAKLHIIEGMGHGFPEHLWSQIIPLIIDHASAV